MPQLLCASRGRRARVCRLDQSSINIKATNSGPNPGPGAGRVSLLPQTVHNVLGLLWYRVSVCTPEANSISDHFRPGAKMSTGGQITDDMKGIAKLDVMDKLSGIKLKTTGVLTLRGVTGVRLGGSVVLASVWI